MNPVKLASTRYTTKAYDASRKIPQEQVDELLACLRLSPSSVNSQPWHFLVASDDRAKARIAKATQGVSAYNAPKIMNASHVVVLCTRTTLDDAHLNAILNKEQQDGRYATEEARIGMAKGRQGYVDLHKYVHKDLQYWMEKQTYIALGGLLWSASALGIDATPIEGADFRVLDQEFDLNRRDLSATVIVALGYHSEQDSNAALPKSRLASDQVIEII
ncbi:oxygen-insensitive NAD(P)H nitroreductase [Celerinatantimonas sp. YJH-8]|uniref:oxygen-insensitive NAD(P)H nitroreductase n=1 Tax=Celerinatantimonas sp. YJH-8 TaxID=3228714 RepID=UPI0038C57028